MATNFMQEKLVEATLQRHVLEKIRQIVNECEAVQRSNESEYTKEQTRLSAYNKISELMKEE